MSWHTWSRLLLTVIPSATIWVGCSDPPGDSREQSSETGIRAAAAHGSGSSLKFTAPSDWISEAPSSSMRQAQYRLPHLEGDSEDAEMVVFFFQGQGGSVQANIDRWIGQFTTADGGPASSLAKISRRESHSIPLTIVDVSGTYRASMGPMMTETKSKPNFRMLAAVAETPNGPWFFKLTGPSKTVEKWAASFQTFLATIQ